MTTSPSGGPRPAVRPAPSPANRGPIVALVAALVVLAAIGAIVVIRLTSSPQKSATNLAPPDVVAAATHVPQATLNQVGIGSTSGSAPAFPPKRTNTATTLAPGGKPLIVYEGAEYCPYCAAERWAMVVALSKFGTFSHLGATTSSSTDVYPNTPTFTFYGAKYSSPYVSFQAVEEATRTGAPLAKPTALQTSLYNTYEREPYLGYSSTGQPNGPGIPFMDFANRYVIVGVTFSPAVLRTSPTVPLPMGTIAGSLSTPSLLTSQGVDAAANYMIGAICNLTKGQPGAVCSAPATKEAQRVLNLENLSATVPKSAGPSSGTAAG